VAKLRQFDIDLSDFNKKVEVLDGLPLRAAKAVWTEAERIKVAVIGLVPVATGYLRTTVEQDPPSKPVVDPGGAYVAAVTVGDSDTPYAKEVHETAGIPNRGWAWNPEEQKAYQKSGYGKFLEFPFFFAVQGMEGRLRRDIQGDLR